MNISEVNREEQALFDNRMYFHKRFYIIKERLDMYIINNMFEDAVDTVHSLLNLMPDIHPYHDASQTVDELRNEMAKIKRVSGFRLPGQDERVKRLYNGLKSRIRTIEENVQRSWHKKGLLIPMKMELLDVDDNVIADVFRQEARISDGMDWSKEYEDWVESYGDVDDMLKRVVGVMQTEALKGTNDNIILITGENDAGKSTLAHHLHCLYRMGPALVENVAFDQEQMANLLNKNLSNPDVKERVVHYDEFKAASRSAMTKWNKDIIDLFFSIRSDKGFHLWCNPSAQQIDKVFIEERITCLIYVYKGKAKNKRRYHLIAKSGLIRLLGEYGNIKQETLQAHGAEYAIIKQGDFKRYRDKEFLEAYEKLKDDRNELKRREFAEQYGAVGVKPDFEPVKPRVRADKPVFGGVLDGDG